MDQKLKIMYFSNEPYDSFDFIPKNERRDNLPILINKKSNLLNIKRFNFKTIFTFYIKYLKFKPDIIVSTWIPAGFVPVLFKKLRLIKCPIVHRWEDYYTESMTNYPKLIVKFMEKFTSRNADYIITVLKTLKEISEKNGKTVFFLPYGINPQKKETKICLDKLKTKKSNLKVIYLGDLATPYKGVDQIIEAAKIVECDLFLFGNKALPKLKRLAKNNKNIHFMGWVDPTEVKSILKQGDILVNTANHDISMKFLDYISSEKPILALNDRPAKFFKHKETAYLTSDFTKGLIELIKDKKVRLKIQKNMKKIKLYSWEEVADIHLELYKAIVLKKDLKKYKTSFYHLDSY